VKDGFPIISVPGIEMMPTNVPGIAGVRVVDRSAFQMLPWDRFVRLKAVADCVKPELQLDDRLLDIGGFDGALCLFLETTNIDLLDPETTGGAAHAIPVPDCAYEVTCAVDVLEHVEPSQRKLFLRECARVTGRHLVLNQPSPDSMGAQELMLQLTGNPFIRQHVEWQLPDSEWVIDELEALGFECELTPHSSVAVWVGQFLAQNLLPQAAQALNQYLTKHHSNESFNIPLYHLISAKRR
jgi:hypothetical protein